MSDAGRVYADGILAKLERAAADIYADAEYRAGRLMGEYLSGRRTSDTRLKKELDGGKIKEKDYKARRRNLLCAGAEWEYVLSDMSAIYTEALRAVSDILEDAIPAVFARNAAWAEYEIFRLTGEDMAGGIYTSEDAMGHTELLTLPSVDAEKDGRWNRQRITAEMMQGIASDKSLAQLSGCLSEVTDGAYGSAIGTVRALITAAENAGRQYIYRIAADAGVELRKTWRATFDHRVRASHKGADGQTVFITDPFTVGGEALMYPGDPSGSAHNVKNCRCGMEIQAGTGSVGEWDPKDFSRWLDEKEGRV